MRRLALFAVLGLPLPLMAAVQPEGRAVPAQAAQLKQQLQRRGVEVERLQRQVAEQESKSRQAEQQLQRQDEDIAALQRQLQSLREADAPAPAAAPGQHPK